MYQSVIDKINNLDIINENDFLSIGYRHCKRNYSLKILKDIKFDDTIDYIGAYHPSCQDIVFNFNLVKELVDKAINSQKDLYQLTDEEIIYLSNFYYLYALFHELRHVEQHFNHDYKSLDTNPLILYLYELCDELEMIKRHIYDKNHDLFPTEIDANYHGFLDSYKILSKTEAGPIVKNIMIHNTLKSPIINYSRVDNRVVKSPLDKLFEIDSNINREIMDRFLNERDLSFEERLSHGLNISISEFHKRYLQIEKVRKLIKR